MAKRRGSHSEREVFWRRHISQQRSLGVTAQLYCRAHGLSVRSFYRWQRRLAEAVGNAQVDRALAGCAEPVPTVAPSTGVEFAEVHVVTDDSRVAAVAEHPTAGAIEVVVSGGRRIRVARGFDEATFLRVVALLEEGSSC